MVALAAERQLRIEERPFTIEEALAAKEAFITSATVFVQAVVTIDGKTVADGKPGPMTNRLREIYVDFARLPRSQHGFRDWGRIASRPARWSSVRA